MTQLLSSIRFVHIGDAKSSHFHPLVAKAKSSDAR